MRTRLVVLPAAIVLLAGCSRDHQVEGAYRWESPMSPGATVFVRNLNGHVAVREVPGGTVRVSASKRWKRGRDTDVRIVTVREGSDLVVCALYGERGECSSRGYEPRVRPSFAQRLRRFLSLRNRGETDMNVAFDVAIPAGVRADVRTVNGAVVVDGASGVRARTVNGSVRATGVDGSVDLGTVNGSVSATVSALAETDPVLLKTVNGSVEATIPAVQNGAVRLKTVNGRVSSEYPLAGPHAVTRHSVEGRIGAGGRAIELRTVNGAVTLRRGG